MLDDVAVVADQLLSWSFVSHIIFILFIAHRRIYLLKQATALFYHGRFTLDNRLIRHTDRG